MNIASVSSNEYVPSHGANPVEVLINITELLEMILLYLPNRDILISQRVCRRFQSTINRSRLLQLKLFFAVEEPSSLSSSSSKQIILNPLLAHSPTMFDWPLCFDEEDKRLLYPQRPGKRQIFTEMPVIKTRAMTGEKVITVDFSRNDPLPWRQKAVQPRYLPVEVDGSWKRMYLSRPACDVEWRFITGPGRIPTERYTGKVEGAKTFERLLEELGTTIPDYREGYYLP